MANKKFSDFTLKTDSANVDFVVGYDGSDNVRIAPSNLGGGATDLNGLTDCLIDGTSSYLVEVPSGLSGNPVDNTVIGNDAGAGLTTGFGNTYIGFEAAKLITDSDNMVIIGRQAGNASSSGSDRTVAIGYDAHGSSMAADNVAVGYAALQFSGAAFNVAIGSSAGLFNSGANAISIGYNANRSNTASETVSIGYEAGYSNSSGTYNIGIGYKANYSKTTNGQNIGLGYEAGTSNTGAGNVAIGFRSGYGTGAGSSTITIGSFAGSRNSLGSGNVVLGHQSYDGSGAGDYNTIIGYEAGRTLTTGENNVLIGKGATPSAVDVDNEVNLYNGSVVARFQGAASAWSFVSDARDKKDIEDLELGLDFIDKLKPRKFKWDLRDSEVDKNKESSGFIAQEIKEVLDEINADYTGIVDTNNPEQYTVSQANIIPMLVKAIQELREEVRNCKNCNN